MCVMVQYVDPKTKKPRVTLLELVRMDPKDCSAEAMWGAFLKCLGKHGIPVTNVIGLACDCANVMVGPHNSFWSRLKAACPWAILLPCACHCSAKVSEYACSELPAFVQKHLRSVTTYLTGSPKRSAQLQEFQEFYEEQLNKILKPAATRWLVLHPCIVQYINLQKSLLGFFELRVFEDNRDTEAQNILRDLKNPYTLAYMHFLAYALHFLNSFNGLFQSRTVMIHKLAEKSLSLMTDLCQNYMKPSELHRIATMNDIAHPHVLLPLEEIYIGPACKTALEEMRPYQSADPNVRPQDLAAQLERDKNAFRLKCLAFYTRAAKEMRKRLPLNDAMFKEMAFIDPKMLVSYAARTGSDGLSDLPLLLKNFKEKLKLEDNALALEWRRFPREATGPVREKLMSLSVEDAWVEIGEMKNYADEPAFPQLCKLASTVMILPHSNADSEREFSIVTDIRTKKRNRMGAECLNALCVARTSFRSKGVDCTTFQVREEHLEKHNVDMYKYSKDF